MGKAHKSEELGLDPPTAMKRKRTVVHVVTLLLGFVGAGQKQIFRVSQLASLGNLGTLDSVRDPVSEEKMELGMQSQPLIPALERQKQEDCYEFLASLIYLGSKTVSKNKIIK